MQLKEYWAKASQYGLTLPNILSYLALKTMEKWGRFSGTLALKIKAALLGVELGQDVQATGPIGILRHPAGKIRLGSHISLISSWRRSTAATLYAPTRFRVFGPNAVIEIGDYCELSGTSISARSTTISLGRGCLIGPNCVITDSDFHNHWPCEERSANPGYQHDARVQIDDYVWIGMQTIILKGVHIGRGAIIGARSVVTRDIPPMAVACGAPAKIVNIHSDQSQTH
ncbi:MAG: acyltransferase [Desulfovibrionaceae bacterium]|nr:acyltransferase [Desulfovibrionaceae bacterium]